MVLSLLTHAHILIILIANPSCFIEKNAISRPPDVSIMNNSTFVDDPVVYLRSEAVVLTSVSLINCSDVVTMM